jgi:hypothetical protein
MQLYPKRLTDADYVESVRSMLARSRRLAVLHGVMAIFFICMFYAFHRIIFSTDDSSPPIAGLIEPGMRIGMMLGAMMGASIMFAIFSIGSLINVIKGQRTERLMLRFHDDLQKRDPDC